MAEHAESSKPITSSSPNDEESDKQFRILIRAHVLQIPGDKEVRPRTLGNIVFPRILGREMQTMGEIEFDATHSIANFNSEKDVKAWFLYDVNCAEEMDREAVKKIPLTFCLAHKYGDD